MARLILILLFSFCCTLQSAGEDLIAAVRAGNLQRVEHLVHMGMDPTACDSLGKTPLMWAVEKGNLDLIKLVQDGYQTVQKPSGQKPTMWQSAGVYGHIAYLLMKAQEQPRDTTLSVQEQNRLLVQAIMDGDATHVSQLLKEGANPNAVDRGRPALGWAAFWGQLKMVTVLVDAGARINQKDVYGFTAYLWAKERGHDDVATLLQKYRQHVWEPLP